jgi:hypothetical protein
MRIYEETTCQIMRFHTAGQGETNVCLSIYLIWVKKSIDSVQNLTLDLRFPATLTSARYLYINSQLKDLIFFYISLCYVIIIVMYAM